MKIILLYIISVGVMFAALLEILHLGKSIKAPIDISGNWEIDNQFTAAVKTNCASIKLPKDDPEIFIEQSGTHITMQFNDSIKTQMLGILNQDKINFSLLLPVSRKSVSECGTETLVKLDIEFQLHDGIADRLSGTWTTPNCSGCGQIQFSASKVQ